MKSNLKSSIGRWIIITVIANTLVTPIFFWMDEVHFLNAQWPAHAKYHLVSQGMILVLMNGVALYLALFHWPKPVNQSQHQCQHQSNQSPPVVPLIAAAVPTLTWLAVVLSAYVVMPLLGFDAETLFPHHERIMMIGITVDINNLLVILTALLPVIGYGLTRERHGHHQGPSSGA
ncbi:MAG: hypothetical protein AAF639_32335 [Chloroflexota bacterium]